MKSGIDPTGEVPEGGLKDCNIEFTTDAAKLGECKFIVVAVPTPVIIDIKGVFEPQMATKQGIRYWRL